MTFGPLLAMLSALLGAALASAVWAPIMAKLRERLAVVTARCGARDAALEQLVTSGLPSAAQSLFGPEGRPAAVVVTASLQGSAFGANLQALVERHAATLRHVQDETHRALTERHAAALRQVREEMAQEASRQQQRLPGSEQAEVFVYVAPRLHALVSRALVALSGLENMVEDPDLLHGLFDTDHLLTRIRRAVESLAVLGGQSARRVRRAVSVMGVLRQAVAEIEHYPRVRLSVPREEATRTALPGHVGPDVIHLLAELVENATKFSPPDTQVVLRAERVNAGIAIEVEDRGLAMSAYRRTRLNRLLAAPETVDVHAHLQGGHTGLLVAARLAQRHGIPVELRPSVLGGMQALVMLPNALLVAPDPPQQLHPTRLPQAAEEHRAKVVALPAEPAPPVKPQSGEAKPGSARAPLPRRQRRTAAPPMASSAVSTGAPEGKPALPRRSRNPQAPAPAAPPQRGGPTVPPTPGLMGSFKAGAQRAAGDAIPASPAD
ncbi:ATP-binding protein [Streptomyces sp. Ru73]|uniref:sensor histidine kinase n=1 Tax=Streptomyces sp. Ru73 TaxID=2080748 RepID=UPI000CDD89EC|nr:ATP-binding protein [Streptomyces sp. Ru73]POX43023.1 ATP-binding protein [Streptomyces sp. Ru73]